MEKQPSVLHMLPLSSGSEERASDVETPQVGGNGDAANGNVNHVIHVKNAKAKANEIIMTNENDESTTAPCTPRDEDSTTAPCTPRDGDVINNGNTNLLQLPLSPRAGGVLNTQHAGSTPRLMRPIGAVHASELSPAPVLSTPNPVNAGELSPAPALGGTTNTFINANAFSAVAPAPAHV